MKNWDRDFVVRLLEEAGRTAVAIKKDSHPELKWDHTLVTLADKAVENLITARLENTAEGAYLIGEETFEKKSGAYLEQALSHTAWILDPVDGTALYAHGIPLWGISLGYAVDGVVLEGGTIIPETGEMLISDAGKTFYAHTGRTPESWAFEKELCELRPPTVRFDDSGVISVSQLITKRGIFTGYNALNSLCATVYPLMLLANGRYLASVTSAKIWDYAGSIPALKNLGFHAILPDGVDFMEYPKIREPYFSLDFSSKSAFVLRGPAIFAASMDIALKTRDSFRILQD